MGSACTRSIFAKKSNLPFEVRQHEGRYNLVVASYALTDPNPSFFLFDFFTKRGGFVYPYNTNLLGTSSAKREWLEQHNYTELWWNFWRKP